MKRTAGLLGFLLLLATSTVNAAVSDEEFQEVKDLLQQALARIEQLEVGNARTNATVAELAESNLTTAVAVATLAESNEQTTMAVTQIETEKQSASWPERISWSGDFRYRYQNEDRDIDAEDRNQQRVRARPAMTAMVTESIDVGFGIATGGDDPVSANQTLGNGASSKRINLDLAYFDWEAIDNLNIRGGKFKNTFESPGNSRLQWDIDWRPEGMDVAYKGETFFGQFLGTWLESDSELSQEYAWIAQA
ncbi:MAG: putative porin, partial [Gammaproteobacteria bacterium]